MTFKERFIKIRVPPHIETHVCELDPPNERRLFWLVACTYGDLTQSYRNKYQAQEAIYRHFLALCLRDDLANGNYQFDDGPIPMDVVSGHLLHVVHQPLEVVNESAKYYSTTRGMGTKASRYHE